MLENTFFQFFCKSLEDAVCTWLIFPPEKSGHEIFLEVFGCWCSLMVSFKVLPGDYLKAVDFPQKHQRGSRGCLGFTGLGWVLGGSVWPLEGTHVPAFWGSHRLLRPPLAPGSSGSLIGIGGALLFSFWLLSHFSEGSHCRENCVFYSCLIK